MKNGWNRAYVIKNTKCTSGWGYFLSRAICRTRHWFRSVNIALDKYTSSIPRCIIFCYLFRLSHWLYLRKIIVIAEIPNILIAAQCTMLRKWDGDVRYIPNFMFRRFGKKHLTEALQKRNARVQKDTAKSSEKTPAVLLDTDSPVVAAMDTE